MNLLTKVYTSINNKILFDPELSHPLIEEQKKYIESFPDPRDEYERSFFKYKCVAFYYYHGIGKILLNFISVVVIGPLFLFYRIKGKQNNHFFEKYTPKDRLLRKTSLTIPIDDIFPEELECLYADIENYCGMDYSKIFLPDIASKIFINVVKKHPYSFHYLLVVLIRLSQQSFLLAKYSPKCITTYVCEREFADPLLTMLSEKYGVRYEAFMHGDYYYSSFHAFMHYSRYWIWSKHYKEMFTLLKCKQDMRVYIPKKYSGIAQAQKSELEYAYFATYYLTGESEEALIAIKVILEILNNKGKKCKIRPHPRFSNISFVNKTFDGYYIEDTGKVSLKDSLDTSYLAISTCSTVLSQAYYSGKKIIVDDCSNKTLFEELKKAEYIYIYAADMLLSELLKSLDEHNE